MRLSATKRAKSVEEFRRINRWFKRQGMPTITYDQYMAYIYGKGLPTGPTVYAISPSGIRRSSVIFTERQEKKHIPKTIVIPRNKHSSIPLHKKKGYRVIYRGCNAGQ